MQITSVPELTAAAARIAHAAANVVAREGLDALSVRRVAREADVAAGTVQHHFATRDALLIGAFTQTVADITGRIERTPRSGPVEPQLLALLSQLLPLDEQRRIEAVVWVALNAAAGGRSPLAEIAQQAGVELRLALASVLSEGQRDGQLAADLDVPAVAAALAAAVDGLTMQGSTRALGPSELTGCLAFTVRSLLH